MKKESLVITEEFLSDCLSKYPNTGKNSHVGHLGILMAQEFFKRKYPGCEFKVNISGIDLQVILVNGEEKAFEVKSTTDPGIAWSKFKVSSMRSHDALINGMPLMRITKIGKTEMDIYFLTHGDDFDLIPEPRFSIKSRN
ncbi:hypothetical protein [Mariniradius sediminis]|uniref:Protein NO VEIN C-terminal domain-containing protein n=1 Tax=Mariniradius sediminis TaxID=2909237 RepID=A0ABS9BZJ2_9BACT|nr:hypothetical protein [Mariniradius sediminis]MCF1753172.1 hypothetical protein [Mariniradius sediminis]